MAEQVIDANIALKWVVTDEPWRRQSKHLLQDARRTGTTLIAPPMFLYEVESVLQRRRYYGTMTPLAVDEALAFIYAADIQIETHPDMVRRAREIARLYHQERIYDSLYAALAELRGCPLWTADRVFYEAVRDDLAFVHLLSNYPGATV